MKRKPQQPPSEIVRRRARRETHAALEALRHPAAQAATTTQEKRPARATSRPPARKGDRANLGAFLGGALPKGRRVTSPTWLAVVRCMPCAMCGGDPHWPFMAALSTLRAQSEANHFPSRGRSGGGSDLETHPACHTCHEKITTHLIGDQEQAEAVARAQFQILQAIRLGWLAPAFLVQVAAEIAGG